MVRAAALAACLLALAAGAAAQCTAGHLKLEFVAPKGSDDPIAKCLTSVRLDLKSNCNVKLTALQSHGSHVQGFWTSVDTPDSPVTKYVECPTDGDEVKYVKGSGTKLEGVRRAAIKAFASYVYGLDANQQYINELAVPDLDFFPGRLVVKRLDRMNLVYAITEADVSPLDMLCDDDRTPIGELTGCAELEHPDQDYNADYLCKSNADADQACPNNSYAVMVVEDGAVNAYNEKLAAFKVCGLCPAGTFGDGFGCSTCAAGTKSSIGSDCEPCPAGTYSNAGSSVCIPCPIGKYNDKPGAGECTECIEDTYSWIEGATACVRCIQGIPEECTTTCTSGAPLENVAKSKPSTHIVSVSAMTANDGKCSLDGSLSAANKDYEIKAFTKCKGWGSTLKLAFTVYGDCSIQISPITDPSCASPTDETGHPYGAIQQRAYYYNDGTGFKIKSRFDETAGVTKDTILEIVADGGSLAATWYPSTTDPDEAASNPLIHDDPSAGGTDPEVCKATMDVLGGTILGLGNAPTALTAPSYTLLPTTWECPPGSYFHAEEVCPICPVGYTCPKDPSKAGMPETKVPCEPNTFNAILGLSDACTECPAAGTYTNYAAAQQCDVEKLDLECLGDQTVSKAFDKASQQCQLCLAGTYRDYSPGASLDCILCPIGTSSKEGDLTCAPCPAGEYSPNEGLADQSENLGTQCVKCPIGSMALTQARGDATTTPPNGASTSATAGTGSTYCDACPAGTWLPDQAGACQDCPENTYRAGDATDENNECKRIPAGYKLGADHTTIVLCEPGTVSFWDGDKRIPEGAEDQCIACSQLDAALGLSGPTAKWAHTFAPRKGMTQCIPCPAGTVPNQVGPTTKCNNCPNAQYRDANAIQATCKSCGAGYEVGPSSKMDCTQCRPGYYMTAAFIATNDAQTSNNCQPCLTNFYRPTFGATSCLPCPRGTQTSGTGNVECTACPIGYHNNQVGQSCKPAPAGTFVNTTGSFLTTPCPPGSWNNEQAQDNCNPCAPGKYSNTFGSKECKTCPAGTFSAGQAKACLDCRPGYAAPQGAAACSPCKPGTFAPDSKAATCKLCPKGYQCPTNAMSKAGPCPRGTFSNKEGNRLCTPCPVNTISVGGGSAASPSPVMACTKCPPGSNTRGLVGQSKCQAIRPQVRRMN